MTDNLAPDQDRIKAVMEIIAEYGSLCFEAGTLKFADGLTQCDRALSAIHFAIEALAGHELTRGLAATPALYNVTTRPKPIRHHYGNRVDSMPFPPVQGPGTIEFRDGDPKNAPLHVRILTEAEVRRIAREEMGNAS